MTFKDNVKFGETCFCTHRCPRYQLSVYRTIGPLVGFTSVYFNGFASSKIYDKCDVFDFEFMNFLFSDYGVPSRASYGVYISHLISFARVCSHVTDLNN